MSTAWTLLSQEVITDALQIVGLLGAGQTASPDDYDILLTALLTFPSILFASLPILLTADRTAAVIAFQPETIAAFAASAPRRS